jgi:phytoene dehydrogenase-like protein
LGLRVVQRPIANFLPPDDSRDLVAKIIVAIVGPKLLHAKLRDQCDLPADFTRRMKVPSMLEDTLAPNDAHLASPFRQRFAPKLPDGRTWDAEPEAAADTIESHAPASRRWSSDGCR